MPLFSVIIPTYNRRELLAQALESVWRQTFTDYEVIVVDDGSTDYTGEWLKSQGSKLRALHQENKGPGAARNLAAEHANGEYLAFLDSDDLWFPWTLEVHAKSIERHGRPSMLSGTAVPLADSTAATTWKGGITTAAHACFLDAFSGDMLPIAGTPSISLKKEAFVRHNGFADQPINGEDTDLWLRLGAEPGFVRLKSPPVFAQRVHSSNQTDNRPASIRGMRYLFRQEACGAYPGNGRQRQRRLAVLAATARSVSLEALSAGHHGDALAIYRQSWWWQLRVGRLRYLAGFPLIYAFSWLRRSRRPHSQP